MDEIGRKNLPHQPPHSVDSSNPTFFLTICAQDRVSAPLIQGKTANNLLDSIKHSHDSGKWWVSVAVVMPDHVHLLASFSDEMTAIVHEWKKWTARKHAIDWQRGFFDHRIRNNKSALEKFNYILQNPVRAGLVPEAEAWPYRWVANDW